MIPRATRSSTAFEEHNTDDLYGERTPEGRKYILLSADDWEAGRNRLRLALDHIHPGWELHVGFVPPG
jgi:hypothetical protein